MASRGIGSPPRDHPIRSGSQSTIFLASGLPRRSCYPAGSCGHGHAGSAVSPCWAGCARRRARRRRRRSSPSRAGRCGRWRCRPTARGSSPSTRPTTGSRSSPSAPAALDARRLGAGRPRAGRGRGAHRHRGVGREPPLRQRQHRRRRRPRRRASSRTLLVGDEPRDIVFAGPGGNRAFITTAHRGQNSRVPIRELTTRGRRPRRRLGLRRDQPRRRARRHAAHHRRRCSATRRARSPSRPDGSTVYAAVFHSGNQTTTLSEGARLQRRRRRGAVHRRRRRRCPGGLPGARTRTSRASRGPETGPDRQVRPGDEPVATTSSAATGTTPSASRCPTRTSSRSTPTRRRAGRRPARFAARRHGPLQHGRQPGDAGRVYVTNTEARNEVRFEGPGIFGGIDRARPPARGAHHRARRRRRVTPRHLNKHIDYAVVPSPPGVEGRRASRRRSAWRSRATARRSTSPPSARARSASSTRAQLENDTFVPDAGEPHRRERRRPERPRARRGARAASTSLTRFDNAISVVDTTTQRRDRRTCRCTTPSRRASSTAGRFLYDAPLTSSNGEASCASCHIFGDFDSLAWDLGNPDDVGAQQPEPVRASALGQRPGLPSAEGADDDAEPARHGEPRPDALARRPHRRQRSGRRPARRGRRRSRSSTSPSTACSAAAAAHRPPTCRRSPTSSSQVTYPPNPIRALDNSLDARRSRPGATSSSAAIRPTSSRPATAATRSIRRTGFFGTRRLLDASRTSRSSSRSRTCATCTRRSACSACRRSPFFNAGDNGTKGDQVRGFGFLHDGSVDTVFRFHQRRRASTRAPSRNPGGFPTGAAGDAAAPAGRAVHARLRQQPGADRRPAGHAHAARTPATRRRRASTC